MANKLKSGKTGEEKEVKASAWKSRIQRSREFQEQNAKNWARNEKLIYGEVSGSANSNEVAYAWGLVKALETSIYVQNPDCIMEPYDGEEGMEMGAYWTSIMRYDFDVMDLKSIGNLGLLDNFIAGYAAYIESIDTYSSTRTGEEDGKPKDYEAVDDQQYDARRIHYRDILFDWQGTKIDLSDHRFLMVAWYPTVQQLLDGKKKGDFPDLPSEEDLLNLPSSFPGERKGGKEASSGMPGRGEIQETEPQYKTVCCWEIHDKVSKKVIYVLDHNYCEIGSIAWPAKFKIGNRDMFPITLMAFHPVQRGFYPKPEMDLIANQLLIINKLDQGIYFDALHKWRKWVTISGLVSPDKAAKITDPSPLHSVIEIDMTAIEQYAAGTQTQGFPDVGKLMSRLEEPTPTQDAMLARDLAVNEINDIIGYGPAQRGGLPQTRSAREAMAINEKLNARLAKRADAVADFYRLFGTKHFLLLQQTLEIDRYARVFSFVTGPVFKKYARQDIQGSFNFRVFAGTSAPRTTEAKVAAEQQLVQTLMPLIQNGMIPAEPVIMRLAEAVQWVGVGGLLKNYKPATKQLAAVLAALKTQPDEVPPQAILEAASAVVMAVLSPQEIQAIETTMQGKTPGGQAQPASPESVKGMRGDTDPLSTSAGGPPQ